MSLDSEDLCFETFFQEEELCGSFVEPYSNEWREIEERFDNILIEAEERQITYADYEGKLLAIIKDQPLFLDAYAHIGMMYLPPHAENEVSTASRWYRKGFKVAQKIIPAKYSGKIEWANLANRPFLRIHHGLILCALRQGKIREAIKLMEQHLDWNPRDNVGIRFLLGEAYLATPMLRSKARNHLQSIVEESPSPKYSLGLLEFTEGNLVQAITSLRKGIAENPYIAEAITGRTILTAHPYWHGTSRSAPGEAKGYIYNLGKQLWNKNPSAVDFLDWLFSCSKCLKERSEFMEIHEGYTTEHDFEERRKISDRCRVLEDNISDRSSETWLYKVTNRTGDQVWPWMNENNKSLLNIGEML